MQKCLLTKRYKESKAFPCVVRFDVELAKFVSTFKQQSHFRLGKTYTQKQMTRMAAACHAKRQFVPKAARYWSLWNLPCEEKRAGVVHYMVEVNGGFVSAWLYVCHYSRPNTWHWNGVKIIFENVLGMFMTGLPWSTDVSFTTWETAWDTKWNKITEREKKLF